MTGRAARWLAQAVVLAAMLVGFALLVIGPPPSLGGH